MDVAVWLRSLGLEQYEALFRENDIDAEVLGDLTDADLEKLGISLGHRKRLIRAIAGLASNLAPSPPRGPSPVFPASANAGRRRRTAPAHGHVLRPRRIDGVGGPARPRGHA
jgi:SAM domain (Sterile alpha motif)